MPLFNTGITAHNHFTTWRNGKWKCSTNVTNRAFENLSNFFFFFFWFLVPWPTQSLSSCLLGYSLFSFILGQSVHKWGILCRAWSTYTLILKSFRLMNKAVRWWWKCWVYIAGSRKLLKRFKTIITIRNNCNFPTWNVSLLFFHSLVESASVTALTCFWPFQNFAPTEICQG